MHINEQLIRLVLIFLASATILKHSVAQTETTTEKLAAIMSDVFPPTKQPELREMLYRNMVERRREANDRSTREWKEIGTKQQWEEYRQAKLQALEASLGTFPPRDSLKSPEMKISGTFKGEGYQLQKVVYESRPGWWVPALWFEPEKTGKKVPAILICHSHHQPKRQGELLDMGVLWARLGCRVLVMDQVGHGERRAHPFATSQDYEGEFRPERQDYYFRYNTGIQLHLLGDSLLGWMVWDMRRGLDLLLAQPNTDPQRLMLLGAVAGGGDPAAVMGALDTRLTAVVPFNFGGPQPESRFPLPDDAELMFNYAGGGSFESTRNLRLSARDGFLPWLIVASIAPRRLSYAHEFAWDRQHDPVWARLEKIYAMYDVPEHLSSIHGRGNVRGRPPEATHCTNIGSEHRRQLHPALSQWFSIGPPPTDPPERPRYESHELNCWSDELQTELKPPALFEYTGRLAKERTQQAVFLLAQIPPEKRREKLQQDWTKLLGKIAPENLPKVVDDTVQKSTLGTFQIERLALQVEPNVWVPLVLLRPAEKPAAPVVVVLCQAGKQAVLKQKAAEIDAMLRQGLAVCVPDLRGTGETRPGNDRGRRSEATGLSSAELLLGQTLLGSQLRDLRSVLAYLRTRKDLNAGQVSLWGLSLASTNPPDRNLAVPHDVSASPAIGEPLGGMVALLGALFEKDVKSVAIEGGLAHWQSAFDSHFLYLPHDSIVPGVQTIGDLPALACCLAPCRVRLSSLIDAQNRSLNAPQAQAIYSPLQLLLHTSPEALSFVDSPKPAELAAWISPEKK